MRILITPLYDREISAVQIEQDGKPPWAFAPFDDEQVRAVEPLGDTHLLALGDRRQIAIWRIADRARTVLTETRDSYPFHTHRAFAPKRGSLFLDETVRREPYSVLREIDLDGGGDRDHRIPKISGCALAAVRGGEDIVVVGRAWAEQGGHPSFLRFDPVSGTSSIAPLPAGFNLTIQTALWTLPQCFSPDGELVIRPHLGSLAYAPPGWFRRAASHASWSAHRDLAENTDKDCYGVALDIYETATGALRTRLLAGFMTGAEIDERAGQSGWSKPGQNKLLGVASSEAERCKVPLDNDRLARDWTRPDKPLFRAILEGVAKRHPYDRWDGSKQVVFTDAPLRSVEHVFQDFVSFPFRFLLDVQVRWHDDGRAITVDLANGRSRDIDLDGRSGPTWVRGPAPKHQGVPAEAVRAIRRDHRSRSVNRVQMTGLDAAACAAALLRMAELMEGGLRTLLRSDVLDWSFSDGRTTFDEHKFFAHLRALPVADRAMLIPPLCRLMDAYAVQTATVRPTSKEALIAGVGSEDEESWTAALTDAAEYLAEVDPQAGAHLRGWLLAVDPEHDQAALGRILVAMRTSTGFANETALRFGLFHVLYAWQTPTVPHGELGLADWARRNLTPEQFVSLVREEAALVAARRRSETVPLDEVSALLLDVDPWDWRVKALL